MATQRNTRAIVDVNEEGGSFVRGRAYGIETKSRVWTTFLEMKEKRGGNDPSHRQLAARLQLLKTYVTKVLKERREKGYLADPKQEPK